MNSQLSKKVVEKHFGGAMVLSEKKYGFITTTNNNAMDSQSSSQASIPTLEELKKKYLEEGTYAENDSFGADSTAGSSSVDVQVIEPKNGAQDNDAPNYRTVIIDGDKIIGSQG